MPDSISGASDTELLAMATQVLSAVETSPTNYGLDMSYPTNLELARDTFDTDLTAHVAGQATAQSLTETKNSSRGVLEEFIREARRKGKAHKTSQADMDLLGIPESSGAAPSTATIPEAQIDTSERLRHTIHFRDAGALDNKRRPRGVIGCEIWIKIGGPPPGDHKECTFETLDVRTPHMIDFDPEHAGQTAHYMMRWQLREGGYSAWGETESATIPA